MTAANLRPRVRDPRALWWVCAALGGLGIFSAATPAQVIDSTPCEQACYEAHTRCVDACSNGENDPVDCEDGCEDALDDCLAQCGS